MTSTTNSDFLDGFTLQLDQLYKSESEQNFSGRGIVIAAGGVSMFTNAYVLIHVLRRHLTCQLPIEVWHFGPAELSPRMQGLLHEHDVVTVDAEALVKAKNASIGDGWQLKSFALLWSRFAEILLLDADQVPAVDPAVAFDWPEYQESGAVFWPDAIELREDNPIWALVGLPQKRMRSLESGQALMDKRRHWKALCATYLLNAAADTVNQLIYGDKDTFLVAWLMTQSSFRLVPHLPFIDEYCLMQRDFSGTIFLQHRTNGKWNYAGEQFRPQRVLHEEASLAALAELRQKWNGRIFVPPGRSVAARQLERNLIERGSLHFEIVGEESFTLQFWPNGEVGSGRSHDRQNWMIVDDATSPQKLKLVIVNATMPSFWLVPDLDSHWTGERIRKPIAPVTAVPVDASPQDSKYPTGQTLVDAFLSAANFYNRSTEVDADLSTALILLAKIEPDVAQRLIVLSEQQAMGTGYAVRLVALAKLVREGQAEPLGLVDKNPKIIENNYIR